jgi:PIN domain nuclease of toxin-antitoxin system
VLLLDTQQVLWLAAEPERISTRALEAMERARISSEDLAIASITLWEIALLAAKGKVQFYPPVEQFLEKVERAYRVLPLDRHIALRGAALSADFPKDPADRQVAATAIVHGLMLITSDEKILKSGEVPCIW